MNNLPEWAEPIEQVELPEWAEPIAPPEMPVETVPENISNLQNSPATSGEIETPMEFIGQEEPETLPMRLEDRWRRTGEMVARNNSDDLTDPAEITAKAQKTGILAAGQVVGAVADTVEYAFTELIKEATPEKVKEFAAKKGQELLQTDVGKFMFSSAMKGQEAWESFADKYPDEAMFGESLFNLSGLGLTKSAASTIEKEFVDIVGDTKKFAAAAMPDSYYKETLSAIVDKGIWKGIRPTVKKKKSSETQRKIFINHAVSGVESIIENKGNLKFANLDGSIDTGRLPRNLREYSQAIEQTRDIIYKQYDELIEQTGENLIDPSDIIAALEDLAHNDWKKVGNHKQSIDALRLAAGLKEHGGFTARQAQEKIKEFNAKLSSYYAGKPTDVGSHEVNKLFAEQMRKTLDDTVTARTGESYQALKNKYGSLLALEQEVNHRTVIDLRQNAKGLADLSGVFAGAQMVNAIATGNAPLFAASLTAKGMLSYIKSLNNPNRYIEKMFKSAGRIHELHSDFNPKSTLFKSGKQAVDDVSNLKNTRDMDIPGIDQKNREYMDDINKPGVTN